MKRFIVLALTLAFALNGNAQDPERFRQEVKDLIRNHMEAYNQDSLIIFAGSSSIRMWSDLESTFAPFHVINHGFGGSHASDLLYYASPLITSRTPHKVFIYEGDNDVAANENLDSIAGEMQQLIDLIQASSPATMIHVISPKPSISRWHLRKKYEGLNAKLKALCAAEGITFIDVWTPMLDQNGELQQDLFIGDDLHMNTRGYDIWKKAIARYVIGHNRE